MDTLVIEYNEWEDDEDIMLHRPGSPMGYAAIRGSIDVGDVPAGFKRRNDTLIRECESGVVGLVAGGIEWLRSRGYSAQEVQSKLRAYKRENLERLDQTVLRDKNVLKSVENISNPRGRKIKDTLVIG